MSTEDKKTLKRGDVVKLINPESWKDNGYFVVGSFSESRIGNSNNWQKCYRVYKLSRDGRMNVTKGYYTGGGGRDFYRDQIRLDRGRGGAINIAKRLTQPK